MTLIRDLIDIPHHVGASDFVLKLTRGVEDSRGTVGSYVVTEQLRVCFQDALAYIKAALEEDSSRAVYLHGSFGSGKSHFMAVLHLLLQGDPTARSIPQLQPLVRQHQDWMDGRRFLLVPYHMIGAASAEAGILGGYAEYVGKVHPEAPRPPVYAGRALIEDAQNLRRSMGDETFFAGLNEGLEADPEWGELASTWNAERFERAAAAPPGDELRGELISRLLSTFFTSYRQVTQQGHEAFLDLDQGLAAISRHAKDLGYDALILFLDELILWLASHAANMDFVQREGQKLVKLVEAQQADRPIPIVSFVARQRDLRDLVADTLTGVEQLNFADVLKHWEARFGKIQFADSNLPAIAEKRILAPKSEAARQQIDRAFEQTMSERPEVLDVLLTHGGNRDDFRKLYPFSPALTEALIALSSSLQRERTSLKAMVQLLVERREDLHLGQVIPVGDLYDVLREGDTPLVDDMRRHFDNANKLYDEKLRPMLEQEHGMSLDEARRRAAEGDDAARQAVSDDRLVKTLLLSALAPGVESLRDLTASKLAALNHGTIQAPIPGFEHNVVLERCRKWASLVGEIRLHGEDANPTIGLELSQVDTEPILAGAKHFDSTGARKQKVRELLFAQLGIEQRDDLFHAHEIVWRGTKRRFDVVFDNVRQLADETLIAQPGTAGKIVIDFPFDEGPHGPQDDRSRITRFLDEHDQGTATIVWMPAFLTEKARQQLGQLVIIDHLLAGDRFEENAKHLSVQDRATARSLLQGQQSQLRHRLSEALKGAYGVAPAPEGLVESDSLPPADRFQSLHPGLALRRPGKATLKDALGDLLGQLLDYRFPEHPELPDPKLLTKANYRKLLTITARAAQEPNGRVVVDRTDRSLIHGLAQPLGLGDANDTVFLLSTRIKDELLRQARLEGGEPLTVGQLRRLLDHPSPRGLPRELAELLILVVAQQEGLSLMLRGGPVAGEVGQLQDEMELRPQPLPSREIWERVLERASAIFGEAPSPYLSAAAVNELAAKVVQEIEPRRESCQALSARLREVLPVAGRDPDLRSNRYQTAKRTEALVDRLHAAQGDPVGLVEALGTADLPEDCQPIGASLKGAASMLEALADETLWDALEGVNGLQGEWAEAGEGVLAAVAEALQKDEWAMALQPRLDELRRRAVRLLTERSKRESGPATGKAAAGAGTAGAQAGSPDRGDGEVRTVRGRQAALKLLDELRAAIPEGDDVQVTLSWRIDTPKGRR